MIFENILSWSVQSQDALGSRIHDTSEWFSKLISSNPGKFKWD